MSSFRFVPPSVVVGVVALVACAAPNEELSQSALSVSSCVDPPRAIHVARSGDDGADGSEAAPLRTIGKAIGKAQPGDAVVVHAGTYDELVSFPRSGEPGRPITLKAACG